MAVATPQVAQFFPTQDPNQQAQILDLQRRQSLANALSQQSTMPDPNDVGARVGPYQVSVKHSPLEYLAKALGQGVAGQQQQQVNKDTLALRAAMMSGMSGQGGSGQNGSSGGLSEQQRYKIAADSQIYGDEVAKADAADFARTNEQKNAGASGTGSPLDYSNAVAKGAEDAKAPYAAPIPIPDSSGAMHYMTPFSYNQSQGIGNPMGLGGAAPSLGSTGGPAPSPPPVTSTPLTPPAGQGAMNISAPSAANPTPPPPGMMGPSALPPDDSAPRPAISPAYSAAVAPSQGAPAPAMGNNSAPVLGVSPSPAQASADKTLADANATNQGEDLKTLHIMQSNLPVLMKRLQTMRDNADQASSGYGVDNEGDGAKQMFANQFMPKTATANTLLKQASSQSVLPELGPQLQQAGVKGNKFLENIANNAVGLDMRAPPTAKKAAIDGLQSAYISNLKSVANRLREQGKDAPTEEQIDAMTKSHIQTGGIPKNVDPQLWGHMTPQERTLFQ